MAVDIDGTLGDFHQHFLRFAFAYLRGYPTLPDPDIKYRGVTPFRIWFKRIAHVSDETWHDIKLAYRQGGQKRTMPVYHGAKELIDRLHAAGAEVWLTTTRPYLRLDNIDPDTRFWLQSHRLRYDGLIYGENKYKDLARIVGAERVCAILDDLEQELLAAVLYFPADVPILRRTEYNSGVTWEQTAGNLFDAASLIERRIATWRELHEQDPAGRV